MEDTLTGKARIPGRPLEKIALSLSGGGYRAAAFHLGAMAYLNHLRYNGRPLLEHVTLLSTVSGGTITGVVYALQQQQGASFTETYRFLLHRLHTLDLVKAGIRKLNPDGEWHNSAKRKNLINAFAELYDEHFTGGATFSVFNEMRSHLEAVVFNSTEFNNGINFRFRNRGTGYFGNYVFRVPQAVAGEVKLADAIAASSCFTGGFEPMVWPGDFVHAGAAELDAYTRRVEPLGLMDGGIYDNQGIESILNYKRNSEPPYFDLVIVSDVSSPYMDPFVPARDAPKEGVRRLTLRDIRRKAILLNQRISIGLVLALLLFLLLPACWGYRNTIGTGICLGLSVAAVLLMAGHFILVRRGLRLLQHAWTGIKRRIPQFYIDKLSHLRIEELSVRRLEPLIKDRLSSLVVLFTDVFLKVVRRLNYYKLYDDERYRYRRMTNLIRELTEADFRNKRARRSGPRPPAAEGSVLSGTYAEVVGEKIKNITEEAASFGTTLWFTEDEQLNKMLDKLVATGNCTMCYNLLAYLEGLTTEADNGFTDLPAGVQAGLLDLHDRCRADWLRFRQDPMFLCAAMGEAGEKLIS
ncbi:MAG TPA: patatin-like phospholipase family protein [Chitinophagaceae bacterium]|jgi:predicted acylesterase/phospholipase RssA|nr:patatin-like phospholipase family protein [Chitinophagaceae bacterium]